ncbi:MAG TPA: hypothetical protein VGE14_01000 [Marmoricola sp.]
MSDASPTGPSDQPESTRPLASYETTGPAGGGDGGDGAAGGRGSRRGLVIGSVAAVVLLALGGAAFAAYSVLAGDGPQPDDVLPASTVALVTIDLDPSASQKIAAIRSIRKFPALKETLGLDADDDLRKFIFDKATADGDCGALDFDEDVEPWVGKRAGFGAVDLGDEEPAPAIALQVSDAAEAKKGFDAIVACAEPGDDFAYVVGEDYLIASDSKEHAQEILDQGRDKPLADDAAYQKWTDEAGDAGVVNFYVARKAAEYLEEFIGEFTAGAPGAAEQLDGFQGLAGSVRFADGGMELGIALGGVNQIQSNVEVGDKIGDLPKDTAVALGFGVPDDYAEVVLDQVSGVFGDDDFIARAETETGLDLPEDLQTLLGSAITLSVGGDAPASLEDLDGPEELPVGLVIHGDAEKITDIVAKVEERTGMSLSDIPVVLSSTDDKVVLSPSEYGKELLADGDLSSDDGFRSAVPEADRANGVVYVDFDSRWRDALLDVIRSEEGDDAGTEAEENTAPLKSLGLSSWLDGDVSHVLVKVSTD